MMNEVFLIYETKFSYLKRRSIDFIHKKQFSLSLRWLWKSFDRSQKITLMMSWWCHQGHLDLGLRICNRKPVLQTECCGFKTWVITGQGMKTCCGCIMGNVGSLELGPHYGLNVRTFLFCLRFDHSLFNASHMSPPTLWKRINKLLVCPFKTIHSIQRNLDIFSKNNEPQATIIFKEFSPSSFIGY